MLATYVGWLDALEQSGLGQLARNSAWFFTVANLIHVLGAAFVVGGIAVFDLKLIADRGEEAQETGRIAIPLAAVGLAMQISTGVVLLAVEAKALGQNPAFYVKVGFILLGLLNLIVFHARFGSATHGASLPPEARIYGAISLASWVVVLLAGRMIAYL